MYFKVQPLRASSNGLDSAGTPSAEAGDVGDAINEHEIAPCVENRRCVGVFCRFCIRHFPLLCLLLLVLTSRNEWMAKGKLWQSACVSISLVRLSCLEHGIAADLENNLKHRQKNASNFGEICSESNQDGGRSA